ncbi:hypothetical protein FRX31_025672 [Thalictrum thalictroides]|uniref:RNase H type-1 domain-containing protein n=1 Tax=Thalictrum thalictroides TaxID=46969 RepID=A0A7J6VKT9_THATH|nr:hypothetical protein FRX31_025672 [Thalictrum thalictroides]
MIRIRVFGTGRGGAGTSEEAECKGMLSAVRWCINLKVSRLELETDCKGAADFLNGVQTNLSWSSTAILQELQHMSLEFVSFKISFCNRSRNQVAHQIAHHVDLNSMPFDKERPDDELLVDWARPLLSPDEGSAGWPVPRSSRQTVGQRVQQDRNGTHDSMCCFMHS